MLKLHRKEFSQHGFSLIELLVVVAIIGILAAVGMVAYQGYTASAKCEVAHDNFRQVYNIMNNAMASCVITGTYCTIWSHTSQKNCYNCPWNVAGHWKYSARMYTENFHWLWNNKGQFKNPYGDAAGWGIDKSVSGQELIATTSSPLGVIYIWGRDKDNKFILSSNTCPGRQPEVRDILQP